jgi:RNA ligase
MVLLDDILDRRALEQLVTDGFIAKKTHPTAPLSLYDYTQRAQYERVWTPETLASRGLIVHDDGQVWARPFTKFFNAAEHEVLPVHEPFQVYDKLDGSLGILYRHPLDGRWQVSTRGSFVSEQAIRATSLVQSRYADTLDRIALDDETWLFEIIYPSNRIVVDYRGLDDLVLLAIIDHDTGLDRELPDTGRWNGRVVTRHTNITDWAKLDAEGNDETKSGEEGEGYVVRFASGLRVKVKFADYVRLHRIVTGVSTITVWEHLSEGRNFSELLEQVPDEFYQWLTAYVSELHGQYDTVESECRSVMADPRARSTDRKSVAMFFADQPNRAVLFKMYDGKAYGDLIWRSLKPAFSKPFKVPEPG